MSFSLVLQRNVSQPNKVDKDVTDVATATGVMKEGASIIDPVFLIDTTLSADMISRVNYLKCETLSRFYYITDIIITTDHLYEIHCHVDVLMSYKTEIREQSAIVARQYKKKSMLLDDGWFMAYQNPLVQTKYLSNIQPFEHQEFVLVLAGS